MHRIELQLTGYRHTGARYRVFYNGKVLIEAARNPIFAACRVLLRKGIKGKLAAYSHAQGSLVPCSHPNFSSPRLMVDIETAAKYSISESAGESLRCKLAKSHFLEQEEDGAE